MKWIPKAIGMISLWGGLAMIIVFVEPDLLKDIFLPNSYLVFFVYLMISFWYTIAIFSKSFWKSLIIALTIVASIAFSTFKIMHPGLAIILLLTLGIESWYTYSTHEKINPTNEQKD